MKEFFVSYSKADRSWAEWIAWQLEDAGYTTIIQHWDFRPGSNFVVEIDNAAQEAARTIAVLSPDYVTSIYTKPEWAARFAEDPKGEKGSLIPVRVRECKLNGLLRQVVYIDLLGIDEEQAKKILLEGVSRSRPKPITKPTYPGAARRQQMLADYPKPQFPGATSPTQEGVMRVKPSLSLFTAKRCNRSQQIFKFSNFCRNNLKLRLGTPQIYFIHGEETECHDSLIERLIHEKITSLAEQIWGNEKGVLEFASVEWAYGSHLIDLKEHLLGNLFRGFNLDYWSEESTADELAQHLSLSQKPLYIIQHNIYADSWNKLTKDLLKWYLTYWSSIKSSRPQFIVFICIVFDARVAARWKKWGWVSKREKKRIELELRDVVGSRITGCPCLILDELTPVKRDEVRDWFSSYQVYSWERMRFDTLERIFRLEDGHMAKHRSMREVEYELKRVVETLVKEHLNTKGYFNE